MLKIAGTRPLRHETVKT